MLINDSLKLKKISKYKLSKLSGVPQATINDICSGKTDLEKCSAGTLYRIAKVLDITVEDILDSAKEEYRPSFEVFKSNTCHHVKDMGDIAFIIDVLESDRIRSLYDRHWFPEALYLLAMLDYLSRENNVALCSKYDDLRLMKLSKPVYPEGVIISSKVLKTDLPLKKAEENAISEFKHFNIMENEVRNVI